MSGHTMKVEITPWGRVDLTPVCHEGPLGLCRLECTVQECREEGWSPDVEHVSPTGDFGDQEKHLLRPIDYCNPIEWITNDEGVDECFGGTVAAPISDGMPITFLWTGDFYRWFVAEAEK
jgi:hypothetical protein